jgi:hypothetical protein
MTTAEQVIALADADVGYIEAPTNRTKFGRWYGMDGQPWCAMAVSKWTYDAGLPTPASTPKGYAYTPAGASWFQSRSRWGSVPRVGAHVFFRFSGPRIHHVGLVTAVNSDGSIDTIEANTSRGSAGSQRDGGGVWRRRRAAGIVGYGYPDYSEEEDFMATDEAKKLLLDINHHVQKVLPSSIAGIGEALGREVGGPAGGDKGMSIREELDGIRRDIRIIAAKVGATVES